MVLQKRDALFLPSLWIHFVHRSVDSTDYVSYFFMENTAFKIELDAGLDRTVTKLPRFECDAALQGNG